MTNAKYEKEKKRNEGERRNNKNRNMKEAWEVKIRIMKIRYTQ
jgi:hypothetical protein